jgi:hypothetical protein
MDRWLEQLATDTTTATTRRGFLAGTLRVAVGLGLGLAGLASGRPVRADTYGNIGCAPREEGKGEGFDNLAGCPKPAGSPASYQGRHNCSVDTSDNSADSDQYGCRPRPSRPYCTTGCTEWSNGYPKCPTGYSDEGYWSCCCDSSYPNDGSYGRNLVVCLDCDKVGGSPPKCICRKIFVTSGACPS